MSREKPSHIPLFVDSYLADTTHLSTEQHGAYFLLLMAAWRQSDCGLPNDESRLAALAGVTVSKWRKIGPAIMEMWTYENGRWRQKRLSREWEYVQQKRRQTRSAVAERERRKRASSDASSDDRALNTYGGGGGGGGGESQSQEEELTRDGAYTREGLTIIPGGAK